VSIPNDLPEDRVKLAIIIGINEYNRDPLSFAVNDAEEMEALLNQPEYGFRTRLLRDDAATRTRILTELDDARRDPPEFLIFYFSGHGYVTEWHKAFLATHGADRVDEGLDVQQLAQILEAQPERTATTLLLLDCCHAGAASAWDRARPINLGSIDGAVRGYSETRAVFAACRPEDESWSMVSSPHGAFTHHLLEGLSGGAADYRGNITIDGLVTYVRLRFDHASQHTVFRCDSAGAAVIGAGHEPRGEAPLSRDQSLELVLKANQNLEKYQTNLAQYMGDWHGTGYADSCRSLRPIVRWFESTVKRHQEMKGNASFREASQRLISKVAHLQTLEPGILCDGREVIECLGKGGFGSVWLLSAPGGDQTALKVFNPSELENIKMRAMFDRGYRAMEQLNHERVVKVRGKSTVPVGFYMDYIAGRNLRSMPPPTDDPAVNLRLLVLSAETIKHAHDAGVIHRDIKPENVLVVRQGNGVWLPFLTDFDLSWFTNASRLASEAMANLSFGAPEYLQAPLSEAAHRTAVDSYSFGQLGYYVMVGDNPAAFQSERNINFLRRRLAGWAVGAAAAGFLEWYVDCTRQKPADRPQEFQEVIDRLVAIETALAPYDTEMLSRDQMLAELAYSLRGLPGEESRGAPSRYRSVSGRTEINMSVEGERRSASKTYYDLEARLSLERIAMSQDTNAKARNTLNNRVDAALRGFDGAKKRYGKKGAYEVFIYLPGVVATIEGVRYARSAIQQVIDTIERT
jgi:serine/threonine protein kinase